MKTTSLLSVLALGAALTGCAASMPDAGGDDGGGDDGGGGDDVPTVPLTAEGRYVLTSDFDVATNMPGTAGTVVNTFIDATDSPDDPSHWIIDQLVKQLPDGSVKNAVQSSVPLVAGYLNDRLLSVAPDFVTKFRDLGNKFGQAAHHFGTIETLDVPASGPGSTTVNGVQFTVDGLELAFMFKDYNLPDVAVPNVDVQVDQTGRLTIGDHKVALSYGKVMRIALDEVVIPLVDPTAVTLNDVMLHLINCQKVGQYVYEKVGIGSAGTFQAACTAGINAGSQALYGAITKVDSSALEFGIQGLAKGVDKNHDGKIDTIQTGAWSGTLNYSGTGAPLSRGNFIGSRQ
jgi:hypothetical protein